MSTLRRYELTRSGRGSVIFQMLRRGDLGRLGRWETIILYFPIWTHHASNFLSLSQLFSFSSPLLCPWINGRTFWRR